MKLTAQENAIGSDKTNQEFNIWNSATLTWSRIMFWLPQKQSNQKGCVLTNKQTDPDIQMRN